MLKDLYEEISDTPQGKLLGLSGISQNRRVVDVAVV